MGVHLSSTICAYKLIYKHKKISFTFVSSLIPFWVPLYKKNFFLFPLYLRGLRSILSSCYSFCQVFPVVLVLLLLCLLVEGTHTQHLFNLTTQKTNKNTKNVTRWCYFSLCFSWFSLYCYYLHYYLQKMASQTKRSTKILSNLAASQLAVSHYAFSFFFLVSIISIYFFYFITNLQSIF